MNETCAMEASKDRPVFTSYGLSIVMGDQNSERTNTVLNEEHFRLIEQTEDIGSLPEFMTEECNDFLNCKKVLAILVTVMLTLSIQNQLYNKIQTT